MESHRVGQRIPMPNLNHIRAILGGFLRAKLRREARRFERAAADCRSAQQQVLRRLLALNADSRFAAAHRLSEVRSSAELRRRLPVTNYEYYLGDIEQMKLGNHRALLGEANPLLMFSLSSGTTSQSKFIPITRHFLRDYRRGWQIWGIRAFDDHPRVNVGTLVQLSSEYDRFRTPGGTPCGNISGLVAAMQNRIVQTMYTVPQAIARIEDAEAKHYTALRLALAEEHVGLVMTANPSTLVHLAKLAEEFREDLIRDIADGTLVVTSQLPPAVRATLRRRIAKRRPRRAKALARIVERTGQFRPQDYWPDLALVAAWTGGSAAAYLHSLRKFYGDVPVRDHGLSASEGRMTIPFQDGSSEGMLDVTSHYFEFIPEREYESERPTVLEAHELEEGRNYFILLTTASGFYRYDICDVVRCTGFFGTTPLLEFLHKGAHIANVTGEKVSESQVVEAVRRCLQRMEIHLKHFTVAPVWDEPPRYQVIAEERDFRSPDLVERFLRGVDAQLQRLNCEYREKRRTGRLGRMSFLPLPEGAWNEFTRKRQQGLGGSVEQYKHPCLVPDLAFSDELVRDFVSRVA